MGLGIAPGRALQAARASRLTAHPSIAPKTVGRTGNVSSAAEISSPIPGMDDGHRGPGVVHEQPLAGDVDLTEHGLQRAGPRVIVPAELRVLRTARRLRRRILVLGPAQLQRDALPLQLLVYRRPVGHGPGHGRRKRAAGEEPRFERGLVECCGCGHAMPLA